MRRISLRKLPSDVCICAYCAAATPSLRFVRSAAVCAAKAIVPILFFEAIDETTATHYNDKVVRQFAIMTVVWGIVGMLVGVLIAAQLLWPDLLPAGPSCPTADCGRCTRTR